VQKFGKILFRVSVKVAFLPFQRVFVFLLPPLPRQKKKKKNDASARDLLAVSLRQDIDDDEWRVEEESDHVAVFNVETGKEKKKEKKKRMCVRVVVNEKRFFFRRRRRRRRRRKRAAERLGDAGTRALGFNGVRVGRPGIRRV